MMIQTPAQLPKKLKVKRQDLVFESWRRGLLSWKLYAHQMPVYNAVWNAINTNGILKYVINCSRRFGKTTILCLIAIEYSIRNSNSQVRFASPTGRSRKNDYLHDPPTCKEQGSTEISSTQRSTPACRFPPRWSDE